MKEVVIFGTGEIAELAFYYFSDDSDYKIAGFTADDEYVQEESFLNLPLVKFSNVEKIFPPNKYLAFVALSYKKLNRIREKKYYEMKKKGYRFASYISSKITNLFRGVEIGENCLILENQVIQHNVKIGNNVFLWSGNHIGHGSIINDHTYISSHVVISGHCVIGKRCFLGVNSTIKDFVNIGDDVFIGMGSLVTRNVPNGAVVVSEPSKIYKEDEKMAKVLKKRYFGL